MNKKHCSICKQIILKKSIRCITCSNKSRKGVYIGDKNMRWKGDKVGYAQLHKWIRQNKPSIRLCECCNIFPPQDLANISGEYKRDINDFKWLCRKCHLLSDGRLNKLIQRSKTNHPCLGRKHTQEELKKMRDWNLGKKMSKKSRLKMRKSAQKRCMSITRDKSGRFTKGGIKYEKRELEK